MTKDKATAPKKSRSTKKKVVSKRSVSIQVDRDVKDSNIIVGDNNQINAITNIVKNAKPRDFILYTLAFLILLSSGFYYFWFTNLRYDRAITSGQLNILIAPFVEEKPWGYGQSDIGWNIAQILADGVKDSFEESGIETHTKILGPADKVPIVHGFNETQLDRAAETISEKINGQIVIYGVISKDEYGDSIVSVKIYISPTNFGEAQELISDSMMGELSLGSFRLTGEAVSGADLLSQNKDLRDRLVIFSSTINFLGAYLGEDFDLAHQYIEQASDPVLWGNTNGLEVISLIHGNMEVRRAREFMVAKDLDGTREVIREAKSHFDEATAISVQNGHGSYARAYMGLAGAESLLAIVEANIRGDASLIDTKAIDRSLEYLAQAEKADYRPEAADIPVKANYAKAQAALAYYAKTLDPAHLESARKYYQLVVDEYENKENKRIAEFAALSYSGLARVAMQNKEQEDAAQYFLSAQKISSNPVFKVQCLVNLGDIYFSGKDYKKAIKYYRDALARKADLEKAISDKRIEEIKTRINFMQNQEGSL